MNLGILGGGSFGMALAVHLSRNGHTVMVWEIDTKRVDYIKKNKKHDLLPQAQIPPSLIFSSDISVITDCPVVLVAVPSQFVADSCQQAKEYLKKDTIVVCCSKGFDPERKQVLYLCMKEVLRNPVAVLSGPSHAEELVHGKLTGVVIASEHKNINEQLRNIFASPSLVVEISVDPVGVQLGGALKNILSILLGIAHGLQLGDNAEALLLTKGFHQLADCGVQFGGKKETFYGLAGLGDLIATGMSQHSRNRRFGELLAQGMGKARALAEVGMVVEGLTALTIVREICQIKNYSFPLADCLWEIIEEQADPRQSIQAFVSAPV